MEKETQSEQTQTSSRPSCTRQIPDRCGNLVAHPAHSENNTPSYPEAMHSRERDNWTQAMEEEFNSLISHNVGELIDPPPKSNIVGGMGQLKHKRDEHSNIIKYKAFWVVLGNHHIHGIYFDKTYASVLKADTKNVLFSLCPSEDWEMEQFEPATAFLNGQMSMPVFSCQVKGFF